MFHAAVALALLIGTPAAARTDDAPLAFGPEHTPRILAELQAAGLPDPGTDGQVLNALAYKALYVDNDVEKALKIFRWNLALMADRVPGAVPSLMDSWAEGHAIAGNRDKAVALWSEVFSATDNAGSSLPDMAARFAKLKADPSYLPVLQKDLRAAYAAATQGGGQ